VQDFSLLHNVQTGSWAHLASYPMGTRGVKPTTHFHLVPRSRMIELYLHSPIFPLGLIHSRALKWIEGNVMVIEGNIMLMELRIHQNHQDPHHAFLSSTVTVCRAFSHISHDWYGINNNVK
jgi:hypothetical protein